MIFLSLSCISWLFFARDLVNQNFPSEFTSINMIVVNYLQMHVIVSIWNFIVSLSIGTKIEYVDSNHLHATNYIRNSKAIAVLWAIFTICYAIISAVAFFTPGNYFQFECSFVHVHSLFNRNLMSKMERWEISRSTRPKPCIAWRFSSMKIHQNSNFMSYFIY